MDKLLESLLDTDQSTSEFEYFTESNVNMNKDSRNDSLPISLINERENYLLAKIAELERRNAEKDRTIKELQVKKLKIYHRNERS